MPDMTEKNLEALRGFWDGKTTEQIAGEMGLSAKGVEHHRKRLYEIFEVQDLVSVCRRALVKGLIKPYV